MFLINYVGGFSPAQDRKPAVQSKPQHTPQLANNLAKPFFRELGAAEQFECGDGGVSLLQGKEIKRDNNWTTGSVGFSPQDHHLGTVRVFAREKGEGSGRIDIRHVSVYGFGDTTVLAAYRLGKEPIKMGADSDGFLSLKPCQRGGSMFGLANDEPFELIMSLKDDGAESVLLKETLLEQAIATSLHKGTKGRLAVMANGDAAFYYRMGFVAKDPNIQEKLANGEKVSGGARMHLPEAAVKVWERA